MPCRNPSPSAVAISPISNPVDALVTAPMLLPGRFGDVASLDQQFEVSTAIPLHPHLVTPGGERAEERRPDHRRAHMALPYCGVGSVPWLADRADLDLEPRELLRHVHDGRAAVA